MATREPGGSRSYGLLVPPNESAGTQPGGTSAVAGLRDAPKGVWRLEGRLHGPRRSSVDPRVTVSGSPPSRRNHRGFGLLAVAGSQPPCSRTASGADFGCLTRITRPDGGRTSLPPSSAEADEGLGGRYRAFRSGICLGWPLAGSPDSRTAHEEPSRPCRQARPKDGPAASASQSWHSRRA